MDFNIEVRKNQLKSLGQFVESSKSSVEAMFKSLGWNFKKAEKAKITCPVNKNHLIASQSSDKHIKRCRMKALGYDLKDVFLSEPPTESTSTIRLDNSIKVSVLTKARDTSSTFKSVWNGHDPDPATTDRLTSTYSSDERLAIYNHCIKNIKPPPASEEFTLSLYSSKDGSRELTLEEQLSQERDARRRRVKYKSVHTNRKSQTEIMREVIDNQMELFTEWLKQKQLSEKEAQAEIEKKRNEEDPFNNVGNQEYQFIQVHTTYGDVPIPANFLDYS